jgi:hypothetical protein
MKLKYFSDDGKEFPNPEACAKYEATNTLHLRLAKLHPADHWEAALKYDKTSPAVMDLAADIETAARMIAVARIAAGDRKRKAKDKSDGAPKVGEGVHQEPTGQSGATGPESVSIGPATAHRPTRDNPFSLHAATKAESAAE